MQPLVALAVEAGVNIDGVLVLVPQRHGADPLGQLGREPLLDVDQFGLDDMDARILKAIIEKFDGGPVGVSTISAAIGEDTNTLEEVYEPFLVQQGFLQRTPRGRVATAMAYRHFGFVPPERNEQAGLF